MEESKQGRTGKQTALHVLTECGVYFGVLLLTLLLFWAVKPLLLLVRKGTVAQAMIALGLAGCVLFLSYMGMTNRLTRRQILLVMLVAGYIIRVGYMLYTPAYTRQQDTFSSNYDGHEAYAWTIFSTGKLPTSNAYQFYHPPLNAMLQAAFMKGIAACSGWVSFADYSHAMPTYFDDAKRYYLYSACQVLSVFYSFMTAVVLVKTVRLFAFPKNTELLVFAFVIFFPRQIQFAGQLNNDPLAYLLASLSLYFALKWQKGTKSPVYVLLCGLAVGLGMMAKLSLATVCLPIAGIFLYEGVRSLRKKEGAASVWCLVWQYAAFLLLCAPLGLWFQVYAKVRFDQPFGFVFSNLNRKLYTGDHSFFERFFFTFDISEYFGSLYCRPFEGNYFLFNYALRSAIFGEFSYWQGEGFAVLAILFAYLSVVSLAISLTWAVVACVRTRKQTEGLLKRAKIPLSDGIVLFLLVQSQVLSEVYFYVKMPYGCTMDFRYIMPLILGLGLLLGYVQRLLSLEGGKFSVTMNKLTQMAVGAFLTSSLLFYCVCI